MNDKRGRIPTVISLLICLCFVATACAQDKDEVFETRHYRKIFSRVLSEERTLRIFLPSGYGESNKTYPVLYHLDADDDNFISSITLANRRNWPEMIVVGIANTDRNRDMIPMQVGPRRPTSGGANRFLSFFTEELFKYVEKNYHTTSERILFGMSNSGLFSVYALTASPDAFDAYISSSPTIGWCSDFIRSQTERLFEERDSLDKFLYIIYGDDDSERVTGYVPQFARLIEAKAPSDFRWHQVVIDGGGHVPPASLAMALDELYSNRQTTEK